MKIIKTAFYNNATITYSIYNAEDPSLYSGYGWIDFGLSFRVKEEYLTSPKLCSSFDLFEENLIEQAKRQIDDVQKGLFTLITT